MSNRIFRVPSYRCKKIQGRNYGCVSLPDGMGGRRHILLGKSGTKVSRAEYARVIAEWEAADRRSPKAEDVGDLTINELILAYWPYAKQHYRYLEQLLGAESDSGLQAPGWFPERADGHTEQDRDHQRLYIGMREQELFQIFEG